MEAKKLEIAKRIIKENFHYAKYGIFSSRNTVGDPMDRIYSKDGLAIDICYKYCYFEVFGLSDDEFDELKSFYEKKYWESVCPIKNYR